MRFLCDDNLGKLAKYLRILGFDTAFHSQISDPELLRLSAAEERYLLTRNHKLLESTHPFGIMLIENDEPLRQLSSVIEVLNLYIEPQALFQRCSRCNSVCRVIDKGMPGDTILPYILKSQEIIKGCPSCGRYYWKGSHYKKMLTTLENTIDKKYVRGEWPADLN